MEEIIEVKFANDEDDFIHNRGVNKGFGQVAAKVDKCYFLTDAARSVYHNLRQYLYGEKRECYPSRETIKQELGGWGNTKLNNALDELEREGLVERRKRDGKNTTYIFNKLQHCFVLVHSESVHEIRLVYQKQGKQNKFYKALTSYRQSDLKVEVEAAGAQSFPSYKKVIEGWFANQIEETDLPEEEVAEEQQEQPKSQPARPLPRTVNDKSDYSTKGEPGEEKEKPKPKSRDYNLVDLPNWNVHHFYSYFRQKYWETLGAPYPKAKGDLSSLKHIIQHNNDHVLTKNLIDTYFIIMLGKSSMTISVFNFSSAFVQQKLHSTLNSKGSTSYKNTSRKSMPTDTSKKWTKQYFKD